MENAIDHNILQGKVTFETYEKNNLQFFVHVYCFDSLLHILRMNSRSSRCNLISPLKLFFFIFAVHLSSSRKNGFAPSYPRPFKNLPGFVYFNYTVQTCKQTRGLRTILLTWETCCSIKTHMRKAMIRP